MENYESIDKALNISETDIVPNKKVTILLKRSQR